MGFVLDLLQPLLQLDRPVAQPLSTEHRAVRGAASRAVPFGRRPGQGVYDERRARIVRGKVIVKA